MKIYKFNLIAIFTIVMLLAACKKDNNNREVLPEGRVNFNVPATTDVIAQPLEIRSISLVGTEMKAVLNGDVSSDTHYVTFAMDTTKIADYKAKYGSTAVLLPTSSYLFYKPTVAIAAGTNISEPAILNLSFQTALKARTSYVLPIVIAAVDGKPLDVKTRRVVYYVFNTGDALYVDNTGYTLTAVASSVNGVNAANRVVDGNNLGTYWLSNITQTLPQWVTVDFGRVVSFSGLDHFFPTAVNYTTLGGNTTSVKIETSTNNSDWTDKGTYAVDIRNADRKHTINLPSITTARYLRFTVLAAAPYSGYSAAFVSEILLRN